MEESRSIKRRRRHIRIRNKISGTKERPRLCVFRSTKHISAQLVDDTEGRTLAAASTHEKDFLNGAKRATKVVAKRLGEVLAERASTLGIKGVVFDRSGYRYHGRIKELAEAMRSGGLKF